jgi:hypothetical protein
VSQHGTLGATGGTAGKQARVGRIAGWAGVWLAFALGACAADVRFLERGEAVSVLLVERADDGTTTVVAYSLDDEVSIQRDAPTRTRLYALGYHASLAELGLRPGAQVVDPLGGPLPTHDTLHVLEGEGWRTLSEVPGELAAARLAATRGCGEYALREQVIQLEADDFPTFVVGVDETRALFATSLGRFYTITAAGAAPLTSLSTSTPRRTAYSRDGELWMVGADGQAVRGTLDGGLRPAPPLPLPPGNYPVLAGPPRGAPLELFATNESLEVAHFDGTRWRRIRGREGYLASRGHLAATWAAPGLAVFLGAGTSSVVEVSADGAARVVSLEVPPRPDIDAAYGAAWIEGLGAMVATRYGVLFRRQDNEWSRAPLPRLTPRPEVMLDLGGGHLLSGGQDGVLVEWSEATGQCEPLVVGSGDIAFGGARLATGFTVVSSGRAGRVLVSIATKKR